MTMVDSVQLDILKALTTHLESMSIDDGYDYDLQGRVFRGRTEFGTEVAPPFVSILEAPRPDEVPSVGGHERAFRSEDWTLLVQGFAIDDKTNPTDPAYVFKANVEKKLAEIVAVDEKRGLPRFPSAYRLGNRISEAVIGPGVVRPPQANVSDKAFFYLPLVLKIAVTPTSPFITG